MGATQKPPQTAQSKKIARWSLLGLAGTFLILFVVLAMIYPLPAHADFYCQASKFQCKLSTSSPLYTKSHMEIEDTYFIKIDYPEDEESYERNFTYQLNVVPNSHVCIYYCFQGTPSPGYEPQKEDYTPVLVPAEASTTAITEMVIVYVAVVLLCVAMLIAACFGARS